MPGMNPRIPTRTKTAPAVRAVSSMGVRCRWALAPGCADEVDMSCSRGIACKNSQKAVPGTLPCETAGFPHNRFRPGSGPSQSLWSRINPLLADANHRPKGPRQRPIDGDSIQRYTSNQVQQRGLKQLCTTTVAPSAPQVRAVDELQYSFRDGPVPLLSVTRSSSTCLTWIKSRGGLRIAPLPGRTASGQFCPSHSPSAGAQGLQ